MEAFSPSSQCFSGLLCIQEDPSLISLSLPSHTEAFPCITSNLRAIKQEEGISCAMCCLGLEFAEYICVLGYEPGPTLVHPDEYPKYSSMDTVSLGTTSKIIFAQ